MSAKMALRRFALEAAGGYRGKDGADTFARGFIRSFSGHSGEADDADALEGVVLGHTFPIVADGKKTTRRVSAYWPERRALLDVVDRDLVLDAAWGELLRACLQMEAEPQYVVLTNQRDIRLYDLAKDRNAPRLSIALDELPKYSEAFPFFAAHWKPGTTPKIINVDRVSKEVADLVAKVYRALAARNPEHKDDVIRFVLQCIVAMFAEDVGLLPKEYFTTLLYQGAEAGDAAERIARLFRYMSTSVAERDEPDDAIPYFNGGLFTEAMVIGLDDVALRALTKAAEANWVFVDPHIFGSVFQGVMDDAERHASGAHYTAREDIMSVVGPTIVEPWRERIEGAKTLESLKEILGDLATYRVLDPACGSGNFLYVAFRELYRLETEVIVRIYGEFPSATKGKARVRWDSGIRTTNFFGIDINPFAVELAKTTLNIAKKIAFEQRKAEAVAKFGQFGIEVDPSLPLDNLDENIVCADALFTEWPEADAIVGNPPFLGEKKIRRSLGADYMASLQRRFPGVGGDLCALWFRLAHEASRGGGRAGLVATSAIRFGPSRESSLDYIVNEGGIIVDAVSAKPWPGEANVSVAVVNWCHGPSREVVRLEVDGRVHRLRTIPSHLQLFPDASDASELGYATDSAAMGVIFGSDGFIVPTNRVRDYLTEGTVRPLASAADVLSGKLDRSPRYVLWVADVDSEQTLESAAPKTFSHLKQVVFELVDRHARGPQTKPEYAAWKSRWWGPQRGRDSFRIGVRNFSRVVACAKVQSRPIFLLLSSSIIANPTLWLFALSDDYSFGVMQSSMHWSWTLARGSRLKRDITYTSNVWKTFPWPQEPSIEDVVAVGRAAQQLRATRDRLMAENDWSLRDLYRSAEVDGPHPLKDAQAALDASVEAAYGKPPDQEATEFLLEMNLALAEDEAAGETIQGPGLPLVDGKPLDPKDPRWFSTDCIEPPPLPGADES